MIQQSDTLVCDTLRVVHWQATPGYDYNRELLVPDVNLLELLRRWIDKLLRILFGNHFTDEYGEWVLALLAIGMVLLLIWFLYKKRPELFMRSRKAPLAYAVEEDTIYGVDFEAEIRRAFSREDWREAVRLLYLQSLKQLSDRELIDWQIYKTPTDYIYELKREELRIPFQKLTNDFLRIRYGNFEASSELFREMNQLQKALMKGGGE